MSAPPRRALALAGLAAALLTCRARAETAVYLKLAGQGASANLISLGIAPFVAEQPAQEAPAAAASSLQQIVRDDLLFSRYFKLVEGGEPYDGGNLKQVEAGWKTRGAAWLVAAKTSKAESKLTLSVSLVDLNSNETVFERYYRQDEAYLRSLGHRVADDLVKAITGKTGLSHTEIAFANDQTGSKEIYLSDYDGANLRRLTKDASISLLPRFSPGARSLAYTSYKDGNPDIFLLDLQKGGAKVLSDDQGLNLPGGFSPDGSQLLMTLSRGKSPNLYLKNLADGSVTRLTQHFGADSSPTFSPDGAQVAFVSDRSGNPQIYLLDVNTQRAKRLTNLNWCDSPSWSPTGEWIAFSGRSAPTEKLGIYLVDVTGSQLRRLTRGEGSNEDPSWSPDGRFLVFSSTRDGRSRLYVMDADGSAPHVLAEIPGGSVTPTWSD